MWQEMQQTKLQTKITKPQNEHMTSIEKINTLFKIEMGPNM